MMLETVEARLRMLLHHHHPREVTWFPLRVPCGVFGVTITSFFLVSDAEAALYRELWHACAGPLVTVPREGRRGRLAVVVLSEERKLKKEENNVDSSSSSVLDVSENQNMSSKYYKMYH